MTRQISFVDDDDNAEWLHKSRKAAGRTDAEEAEVVEQAMFLQQAINSSKGLPRGVLAELTGTAGFVAADDVVYLNYVGLTPEMAEQVKRHILDSVTQEQGWSTDSIVKRIQKYWEMTGFTPEVARMRAETVARTEVRSIASEFRRRQWREEEADRGQVFKYHVRGADDHRTTKQSYWVRSQIPDGGIPLDQMERLLDEAVMRAIRGDFSARGVLSSVRGKPMQLPPGFRRRGFLVAFNDRDQVFRVA